MHDRIKQLRLAKGYSLDDLSAQMGGLVSKQALSKYEKGEMQPSPSVLTGLAAALGVKTADLLRPAAFTIEKLAFRKKAAMGMKEMHAIEAWVRTDFEKRLQLQARLPGEKNLGIKISRYAAETESQVDEAAEQVRQDLRLGVDPIGNLTALLEDHFVHVLAVDASVKFDGFSALAKDTKGSCVSAAVVCRKEVPGDRQRLTLAHELGHLVLKQSKTGDAEKLAYRFGAAFLVPRQPLIKEVGEKRSSLNLNELLILKSRFGVSIQALVRRMRDLNIISEPTYKSACIAISQAGWRTKEPGKPVPREESTWLEQTALRAWSEGIVSDREIESLIGSVPDRATETGSIRRKEFLKLSKAQRNKILQEQAKTMEQHYASPSDWDTVETEDWP